MNVLDKQIKRENLEVDLGILKDENILIILVGDQDNIEPIFNYKVIKNHPKVIVYKTITTRYGKIFYHRYNKLAL